MLATVAAASLLGVTGHAIDVEVHVGRGLPSFTMVGLPDAACREARDRVRAALLSSGLPWPQTRITVNLAPSGVPKLGTSLDLGVAVGLLVANGELPADAIRGRGFIGEVGLDGTVRAARGIVPLVIGLRDRVGTVVVPLAAVADAAVVPGVEILGAATIRELVAALRRQRPWPDPPPTRDPEPVPVPDLADVRGQPLARTAVEIAAAGGHHLLLSGPPGSGKTLLATRLPGLLPDLDDDVALTVTRIHSAAGSEIGGGLVRRPPLRAPHHTASAVSLIGGGAAVMRPGEISLAHGGVLFCDELGEFAPTVLDALRQPLEDGVVRVSRARASVTYPARFQFVAATNPCPCGPGPDGCRCSATSRARYVRRLSGPLLDRFDLRVEVTRPDPGDLLSDTRGEPSRIVAERVSSARVLARRRGVGSNASLSGSALAAATPLDAETRRLLEVLVANGSLSGRGVDRIRRVARTVADLAGNDGPIRVEDIATALAFRVAVHRDELGQAS